jgi:vacuolar-type H+-ATPase subunit H
LDEKLAEEIQFHQDTVESDEHSPLHLIREKEMEISGRVLAAKRQAEEIDSEARRAAAGALAEAHESANQEAVTRETAVKAELEQESERVRAGAEQEAAALQEEIDRRRPAAVQYVIDAVVRV